MTTFDSEPQLANGEINCDKPKKPSLAVEMIRELEAMALRLENLQQKVSVKLESVYLPITATPTDNKEPVPEPYPELFDRVRNTVRNCTNSIHNIEEILNKVGL